MALSSLVVPDSDVTSFLRTTGLAGARPASTEGETDRLVARFERDGFLGPVRIFEPAECRRIAAYLDRPGEAPPDWEKGRAVRERFLFDLAVRPALLSLVTTMLGNDVVLWGATALRRAPGVSHPWHSDIESCTPDGGFLTAWIGIEHTTQESALQVITGSHRLGATVQEVRQATGIRRDLATPEIMLAAARTQDPSAALVQPDMTDGDALLFDGRLWHGSLNRRRRGRRLALLLQYAAANRCIRIPDLAQLDWPFRFRAAPRPPVIVVSGTSACGKNRLVPQPPLSTPSSPMVTTAIHPLVLPVDAPKRDWEQFPAFCGPTATLRGMSCHASVLAPGRSPHVPHTHAEEELLIPLRGEVELVIAAGPDDPAPRVEHVGPGSFVYYPSGQHHTVRSAGAAAAGYLMFKWQADPVQGAAGRPVLGTSIRRDIDDGDAPSSTGVDMRRVFEGPTTFLGKLHAHVTTLQPGAGYAPHVDGYDVAILTLAGTVETLGVHVDPLSVIYYAAGEAHGMRNVGTGAARYLVFEFHAAGADPFARSSSYRRRAASAVRMGKRVAGAAWRRVRGG